MEWHQPDKTPNGELLVHALVERPSGDAREELVFHANGKWMNWNGGSISGKLLLWQYGDVSAGQGNQWTREPPPAEAEGQQFEVQGIVVAVRLCHLLGMWHCGCWKKPERDEERLMSPVFASRPITADDEDLDELLKNPE